MDEKERQQIIDALDGLEPGDTEWVHEEADSLIIEALDRAGYQDIANAWRRTRNRIGFWYV